MGNDLSAPFVAGLGAASSQGAAKSVGRRYPPHFSPLEIDGLSIWLDALDPFTIALSGSNVTQWSDKSGKANHATQGTGANQPLYNATGLNALPTLIFDATDILSITDAASLDYTQFTAFAVFRRDTDTGNNQGILGKATISTNKIEFNMIVIPADLIGSAVSLDGTFGGAVYPSSGQTATVGTAYVETLYYDGANAGCSYNMASAGTAALASVYNGTAPFVIGKSASDGVALQGRISEVLFYTRKLGVSDIRAVQNYLMGKWGI